MKKLNITRVYRQSSPDAEDHGGGGTVPEASGEVPAEDLGGDAPDEGQDTIPEEVSLWDKLSRESDDDEDEAPADLSDDDSDEPEPEETTPEAPAEPEPETPTETPAEEPTAADTATPTEPEEQPTAAPEPEPTPQPTAEDIQQQITERKNKLRTDLEGHFKISDEEALQLVTDPGKVFPKLQARMFTEMWMGVEQMLQRQLPQAIEMTTREMKVRDEKVDDFFKAWPKLDRKTHAKQVAQVAKVFSQINPNATEEETTKHVGMQVMMMNGIAPDMVPVDSTETPTAPPVSNTPHRPAAVHGARAPDRSEENLYTKMSMELEEDED